MRRPANLRCLATWAGLLAVALTPARAGAAAFNVEARTEAQAYELRAYRGTTPSDVTLLPRRRVVQYLGLDAYELVTGQDFGFESNLRVYSDFGLPRDEGRLIDGVRTVDADLTYANLRYRKGGLEGVLGRQYLVDTNDILALDGLKVRYVFPGLGLGAEAYAGLWVKGTSFLGTPTVALDGVPELEQGPRTAATAPSLAAYLGALNQIEPVFGGRLLAQNVAGSGISSSVGYRMSTISGSTSSQRLSAELQYGAGRGLNLLTAAEYDLMLSRISNFRALGRYDGDYFAAQLEALRFAPTFSAMSLWYYFATAPRDEVRLRGDVTPVGPLRYYVQLVATQFDLNLNADSGLFGVQQSGNAGDGRVWGAGGGASLVLAGFHSAADLTWRNGWGGRQLWADLTAGYRPKERRWTVDGRFSFARVRDPYNPLLRGDFYGGQLWGSYLLTPAARASLVFEENVNPFTRSDTRVFLVFDLKAVL